MTFEKNTQVKLGIEEFLELRQQISVVDVRTPAEYEKAHIPGAINIPLFSNEQRVVIGTLYKQESKDAAILKGLDFIGPEMKRIVLEARKVAKNNRLIVHCWRGGMRSESVAWLLNFSGLEAELLDGGYKTYRRHTQEQFVAHGKFIVLGGMTGSGKTEILLELKKIGEQVIDLEGLANHKGSVFGGIGQAEQPTTEMFENLLGDEIYNLDGERSCWIEDESANIGKVRLPQLFWDIKRTAPIVELRINRADRLDRLVNEYGSQDVDALSAAIHRITKRLGHERTQKSLEALKDGDMREVASITLDYYDKGYKNAMGREEEDRTHMILEQSGVFNAEGLANDLSELMKM